ALLEHGAPAFARVRAGAGAARRAVEIVVRDRVPELERALDDVLDPREREGGVVRDRPRELLRGRLDLRGRYHLVHHADLVGSPGVDGAPGEHEVPRVRGANDLDELLPELERYDEAD